MKKHRGLKRYYRNLAIQSEDWLELNFSDPESAWFRLWHTHFDWYGFGNNSFKRRKPHLDKLFRHFELLMHKAENLKTDYQLWAMVHDRNSAMDAIYLHTPNPDAESFPLVFPELSEQSNFTNHELQQYLDNLSGYRIYYVQADENFCIVFKDTAGLSLKG